jgi:hypothetical protein
MPSGDRTRPDSTIAEALVVRVGGDGGGANVNAGFFGLAGLAAMNPKLLMTWPPISGLARCSCA